MLEYQKQLQQEKIYELNIPIIIAESPSSGEQDFNTPFHIMGFIVAIFTFIRFMPFFIMVNIFLKNFYY